jgi:glyoxylase-like metal-dependent hydrolase (beta-lactamase superfamily II)
VNLEDHLGDIVRKGRLMSGTSSAVAAAAAGLTEAELATLEATGAGARQPNYAALAGAVGLNAVKLQHIADGWQPTPKDLSRWRHLRVFTTAGEGLTVNSYLVWDDVTRAAALFDTGFDAKLILDAVATERLELQHIFITHSHHDHIAVLGELRSAVAGVNVHTNTKSAPPAQRLKAGERFCVGKLEIAFRETPGHAPDGVTYLVGDWPDEAPPVAIVGDALFAGSMGRGNQSWEVARQKVREHILTLPPATLLCPGHGPLTTVAEEREHNPFF